MCLAVEDKVEREETKEETETQEETGDTETEKMEVAVHHQVGLLLHFLWVLTNTRVLSLMKLKYEFSGGPASFPAHFTIAP